MLAGRRARQRRVFPNHYRDWSARMADSSIAPIWRAGNSKKDRPCLGCGAKPGSVKWYEQIGTYCADCWCNKVKERRDANIEAYRARDRARNDNPKRVEARKLYQLSLSKEKKLEYNKKYFGKFPEKRSAHVFLGNAVRDGKIKKPSNCEKCGAECTQPKSLHAHHVNYSRPLDVT